MLTPISKELHEKVIIVMPEVEMPLIKMWEKTTTTERAAESQI